VALAVVVAVTLVATSTPVRDADARPGSTVPAERGTVVDGDEHVIAATRGADAVTEAVAPVAQLEQATRFYTGVAIAEMQRVAAEQAAAAARAEAERVAAEQAAAAARTSSSSSMGGGWAALRRCESGGDYGAVSSSGTYRGAYQFSRSTWNSVASSSYPHLVGVDPAAASAADQDAMAMALYRSSGSSPWPHCGRHL
jgi:hypothetical protein